MRKHFRKHIAIYSFFLAVSITVAYAFVLQKMEIATGFVALAVVFFLSLLIFISVPIQVSEQNKVQQEVKAKATVSDVNEITEADKEAASLREVHRMQARIADARKIAAEMAKNDEEVPPDNFQVSAGITFDDIAGYEQTKKSLQFIVSCMTDCKKLQEIGATIPRGILLYGPPGTGKTLLAKAIAGTAGVPMFAVSASQFVEIYVGNGAKNVRALYAKAREHTPCIVFIDEIDAVGGTRQGNTNDERRQTLNALLVEMNGIQNADEIITIAATNDMENLDPALLRPGRFDRKIMIPLPDMEDRKSIIELYLKKKKIAQDVDIDSIAMITEGFSGASLSSLINEAAIHAVYEHRDIIEKQDLDEAFFQVITGGEKKQILNHDDLKVIAYHEAGHALALKLLTNDVIPTVTIIGSTSGAGGYTFRHSAKESCLFSRKALESQIKILFAGRAGEECYFGNGFDITNGSSDDLKKASQLLREYLTTYGMGEQSLLNVDAFTGQMDGDTLNEAKQMAETLYSEILSLLKENRKTLVAIAQALLSKNTLTDVDLVQIIRTV